MNKCEMSAREIAAEKKELQECIQINAWNLEHGEGMEHEQRQLMKAHSERLAELVIMEASCSKS